MQDYFKKYILYLFALFFIVVRVLDISIIVSIKLYYTLLDKIVFSLLNVIIIY